AHALRALSAHASDDATRFTLHLMTAILLEAGQAKTANDARPALVEYREALRVDPRSPTAAIGASRLAAIGGDAEATIAAACARAELATDGHARAVLFVQAAGALLATHDARLGDTPAKRARAV